MTSRSVRLAPFVAGAGGVLSVATLAMTWASGAGPADFVAENQATTWLAGLSSGIVAVLILRHRPVNRLGVVFAVASLSAAVAAAADAYAGLAFGREPGLPLGDLTALIAGIGWIPAFLLFLTGAPLLFPAGRPASPGWRWPIRIALGSGIAAVVLLSFTETVARDVEPAARNPLGGLVPDQYLVPPAIALFGVVVAIGIAATLRIAIRMRRLDEPERQQHAWYVAAVGAIVVVTWLPVPNLVSFLVNGLSVLALGVAIVRYRLFDIEVVLARAVVYTLLAGAAMAVYLLGVALLGLSVGGGLWPALAAAVAALALGGVRGRLLLAVNRALYGDRANPFAALVRLGQRLESAVAADDIVPVIAETARQSLRAPYAAVELAGESGPAHASGTPPQRSRRFDLIHAGEHVGTLIIGFRPDQSDLANADLRLVTAFSRQAAVAAHDVRVTRELRRSRERIVLAREEERRRLRRDLHDGLGPALAGVSLGLETAGRAAVRHDDDLPDLIRRLHAATIACAADVRRVVADLRPPALDAVGLVEALRQHADLLASRSGNGLQVSVSGSVGRALPAAVELAAYRIALEALTNAVRHANAHSCTVSVSQNGDLRLTVGDDGSGIPASPPGVGLTSMKERADELGGRCVVTFAAGRGTTVDAVLPIDTGAGSGQP